jgi:hypothetical protein
VAALFKPEEFIKPGWWSQATGVAAASIARRYSLLPIRDSDRVASGLFVTDPG